MADTETRDAALWREFAPKWAESLNRRATVEQWMFDAANGKRPMPTPEQLREWAMKLGVGGDLKAVIAGATRGGEPVPASGLQLGEWHIERAGADEILISAPTGSGMHVSDRGNLPARLLYALADALLSAGVVPHSAAGAGEVQRGE